MHQRNWEAELKLPVLSRHDVIFSIFQQNARTAEGKLQVELASLKYELPRIVRSYEQLDPLAGGIGTIGPGEQLTERIKRRATAAASTRSSRSSSRCAASARCAAASAKEAACSLRVSLASPTSARARC